MKPINVSVVGLSGTEKEKGQVGVGKSCLCNRFIRPMSDDYFIDHISVLSQSDFSGRIVNNDHFLYWGQAKKTSEEGVEYNFQLIEQTEFLDDSTFQPFKVGKMEPYIKRCTTTKVASAEKLMYVCKNQLGIEKEYEQKMLPDGRLAIDGFIVVFDVSLVPNRSLEKQVEFVNSILITILKTKKPILLVTTKNDDANDVYVREAEKICQRKEYKGAIQLVETSAHESVNIDMPFFLLAQLIDKTKTRTKITSYQEAARNRKELLDIRTEAVALLVRNKITDYRTLWSHGSKNLSQHREWIEFSELFGQEAGQQIFRRHMKKLRDDHLNKKLHQYMNSFSCALQDLIPDTTTLNIQINGEWNSVQNFIRQHVEFDQYFFDSQRVPWTELSDISDIEDEVRIPFDILDTPECETVLKNHLNTLQQEEKRLEWKKQFKQLLEETGYVTPGKQLSEVRVLFMGRECFEALSEHDCQQIYDNHQKEIIDKTKQNFIELLLEHADLFQHFKNIGPTGTITQEDIKDITEVLQDDLRYKMLDRLDPDRKVILFQHLGFIHCPIREHCPAFPTCMDSLFEKNLTSQKPIQFSNQWGSSGTETSLNLLIMGSEHLASDLLNDIRINSGSDGEYVYDNKTFYLNYRIVNGDMESFKSIDNQDNGLICVYSNLHSFETLKDNLERSLMCNLELEDKFENFPIVLVYQPHDIKEKEIDYLRAEGFRLSETLHCEFIDTLRFHRRRQTQQQKYIYEILNNLIMSLRISKIKCKTYQPEHPDLRIVVSMFCGDPFSPECVIDPLVAEPNSRITRDNSVLVDTFLGETRKTVEFILLSYHSAYQYRNELVHGYILFYSTERKSSLTNLNAIAMSLSKKPIQIIAVTKNGGANAFFNNDICQLLITEGNSTADRCRAHFMTSSAGLPLKFALYIPFLKKVWENKLEIESLNLEESKALDSGEGTSEHSLHHLPQLPHRLESYMLKNAAGTDGSGSENYEQLPTRSLNSLNGEKDISMEDVYDDQKNEKTCILHQGWLDDALFINRDNENPEGHGRVRGNIWNNFGGSNHAFTTGRRQIDLNIANKIRPKGPSQTLKEPGKLNLKNFQLVSDAVARMNISVTNVEEESDSDSSSSGGKTRGNDGYHKLNRKALTHKRLKKKRAAIPVKPPKVPLFGTFVSPPEIPHYYQKVKAVEKVKLMNTDLQEEFSVDRSCLRDKNSTIFEMLAKLTEENERDKLVDFKVKQKSSKEEEKFEKRRLKEEHAKLRKLQEKEKEQEKRQRRKSNKNSKGSSVTTECLDSALSSLPEFMQFDKNNLPIFLQKCIQFIEQEGMDSEGIYRVPGNRAHVDLLFQKFEEEPDIKIEDLDIPVNAVATALKEFFSKLLPPLFDKVLLTELEDISAGLRNLLAPPKPAIEVKSDRSCRLMALRTLLNKLPSSNLSILKFIFQHFVRVSENSKLNSMDSKNLAICWWPTLIQIEFTDMSHFEQLRPYLEDIVQTMIDQFPYLFCGKDAFVMV